MHSREVLAVSGVSTSRLTGTRSAEGQWKMELDIRMPEKIKPQASEVYQN